MKSFIRATALAAALTFTATAVSIPAHAAISGTNPAPPAGSGGTAGTTVYLLVCSYFCL